MPSTRTTFLAAAARGLIVKVCCIATIEEAEMALDAGANALGLVSAMPSGPGVIGDADIARIAAWVGSRAATVLLTSRLTADGVDAQLRDARPAVLQLVDALEDIEIAAIRTRHPDVVVIPVVHVQDEDSVREAVHLATMADAILLDSGNPTAAVKELGGTGRVHDWQLSRAICQAVGVPVLLAGGLSAANVAEAVRTVRPAGVDVCSGVRREGRLDHALLGAFVTAARSAV